MWWCQLSSLSLFSFCTVFFCHFCSPWLLSITLSSRSLIYSSASSILLLISSSVFLISLIVPSLLCCFFISVLRVSLISWILFWSPVSILMIIVFNSLSGMLLISLTLRSLAVTLFCSFIWDKFLCLLILSASLCWRKSAVSSPLESSDFMKKRSWNAQQCSVSSLSEPGFQESILSVLLIPCFCAWVTFPFIAVSALTLAVVGCTFSLWCHWDSGRSALGWHACEGTWEQDGSVSKICSRLLVLCWTLWSTEVSGPCVPGWPGECACVTHKKVAEGEQLGAVGWMHTVHGDSCALGLLDGVPLQL